jgi:hypothetical protein
MRLVQEHTAPLFELAVSLLQQAYPATREGEMAAAQLLMSFYGMVIAYFTYDQMLGRLIETDPLSEENLSLRKRHLCRMISITLDSIAPGEGGNGGNVGNTGTA